MFRRKKPHHIHALDQIVLLGHVMEGCRTSDSLLALGTVIDSVKPGDSLIQALKTYKAEAGL